VGVFVVSRGVCAGTVPVDGAGAGVADVPEPLAQALPNAGFSAAATFTVLPQALTGMSTGTWTVFPDATPGEPVVAPSAPASANTGLPHRDRMPVAAAAATIPLLRVCRNLVVFLLVEMGEGKPALEPRSGVQGRRRRSRTAGV
jgi:hypothetical protein